MSMNLKYTHKRSRSSALVLSLAVASLTLSSHAPQRAIAAPDTETKPNPQKSGQATDQPSAQAQPRDAAHPVERSDRGEADEVLLERVQRFYAAARDFSADFRQTYTYHIYGRKKISTGKVFFKKPAKMRWDYEIPTQRFFVADGQTLWVYEPDKAQVFKRALSSNNLPVALRFMKGEGKLSDDFTLAKVERDQEGDLVTLHLKPRRPTPDFVMLKLTIKRATGEVTSSVLIDPTKNSNQIDFVSVKVNQDLQDKRFSFTPPQGVNVIDEASATRAP